jgi:hypothetical protein
MGEKVGEPQKQPAGQGQGHPIVVLLRNTTWRCGKLEKSIVKHLYRKHEHFGKPEGTIGDIMAHLNITGEKKDECLDAIRRLEKRNIVKILSIPSP